VPAAAPGPGPAPGRAWAALDRAVGAAALVLNGAGAVWILGLMVLINLDVGLRAALNAPLPGVPEFVALSITGIVFLQAAHTLRAGRFIRSDGLAAVLLARRPRVRHALQAVFGAVGAALFGVIAWAMWPLLRRAWTSGEFVGAVGDVMFPVWPVMLIVVVGSGLTAMQYAADAAAGAAAAAGRRA